MGNIGKDAQLRKVKVGENEVSVLSVWVAENIKKRDGSTKAIWHKVTIWRGYAEAMAQYLKSGRLVFVTGTAEAKSYTTQDNRLVPYIDVQASEIKLLDGKKPEEDVPPEAAATDEETPW
jgi:single-strand DNA-binding protein